MDNNSTPASNISTTGTRDAGLGANTLIIMYSVLLVSSLFANGIVIAVVVGNKTLRTFFNTFIVNIAISDLVIPLIALPIRIIEITKGKPNLWLIDGVAGNVTCKIFTVLVEVSPGVSVFSLVIIAVNRFVAIVAPFYHVQLFSARRCKILIAVTWIAVTVILSPYFYISMTAEYGYTMCGLRWLPPFDSEKSATIFSSVIVAVFFIGPFVLITVLYSTIVYKLHKDAKTVEQMLGNEEGIKTKQRNKHIFYISVVMIVAFAVFWGPFFIVVLMLLSGTQFSQTAFLIVQYIGYSNSIANTCIYFIFLGTFRDGFKRLFCRCLEKEPLPSNETGTLLLSRNNSNIDNTRLNNATTSL